MIIENRDSLNDVLEPFIFVKLSQENYQIIELQAVKLLTWNRFVIAFNLFYLEMREKNQALAEKIYTEMIRATSLDTFIESEYEKKKSGMNTFFEEFEKTYESITKIGFNRKKTLIPLAKDKSILNGTHRVASAIYANKNVYCVKTELEPIIDDFKALYARNISQDILDLIAIKYVDYSENTFMAFLWSSGKNYYESTEQIFGKIVYKKDIELTPNGAYNLLIELYKHMDDWTGTAETDFKGIKQKLIECFPDFSKFKVIIFEAESLEKVRSIKEEVRNICNIGYSSIHITDTKEEVKRISRLIFNSNGIHFLNYANPYKYRSTIRELDNFMFFLNQNNILTENIIIDGSFVLSLYGLRQSNDLDYLLNNHIEMTIDSNQYDEHDSQLKFHQQVKNELIYNPKYYFEYLGLKFISFDQLYLMKKNRNENKDINDCYIMRSYLTNNKIMFYTSRLKQNLLYLKIKIKNKGYIAIIYILKKIALYNIIRTVYKSLRKKWKEQFR